MASLDFSMDRDAAGGEPSDERSAQDLQSLIDQASLGTKTKDGMYEVKDWEFGRSGQRDETDDIIARALAGASLGGAGVGKDKGGKGIEEGSKSSLGALGGLFARFTGGKVLTQDDLKPVLEGMKQHLMKKNVAMDIAEKVCEGVGEGLVGKKVGGLQSKYFLFV